MKHARNESECIYQLSGLLQIKYYSCSHYISLHEPIALNSSSIQKFHESMVQNSTKMFKSMERLHTTTTIGFHNPYSA
jgi:hypothetical protein